MKVKHVAVLFIAVMWIGTLALSGQNKSGILKAGKEGKFTLNQQAHVAGLTLQPGDYIVQHRVIDNDHYVRFQQPYPNTNESMQFTPTDVGVIKCRVESLSAKAKETRIFTEKQADGLHITRVEVAGESVAHAF